MQTIAVENAREHFSDLLAQVESGETFAIMERGEIKAMLYPPQEKTTRRELIAEFKEYIQKRGLRLDGLSINALREEGRRG